MNGVIQCPDNFNAPLNLARLGVASNSAIGESKMKKVIMAGLASMMLSMGSMASDGNSNRHYFGFGASITDYDAKAKGSLSIDGRARRINLDDHDYDGTGIWLAYRWQHWNGWGIITRVEHITGDVDVDIEGDYFSRPYTYSIDTDVTTVDLLGTYTFPKGVYLGGGLAFADNDYLSGNSTGAKIVVGGLINAGGGKVDIALEQYWYPKADEFSNCAFSFAYGNICTVVDIDIKGYAIRVGYLF